MRLKYVAPFSLLSSLSLSFSLSLSLTLRSLASLFRTCPRTPALLRIRRYMALREGSWVFAEAFRRWLGALRDDAALLRELSGRVFEGRTVLRRELICADREGSGVLQPNVIAAALTNALEAGRHHEWQTQQGGEWGKSAEQEEQGRDFGMLESTANAMLEMGMAPRQLEPTCNTTDAVVRAVVESLPHETIGEMRYETPREIASYEAMLQLATDLFLPANKCLFSPVKAVAPPRYRHPCSADAGMDGDGFSGAPDDSDGKYGEDAGDCKEDQEGWGRDVEAGARLTEADQKSLSDELAKPMDASDVATPRGETAKAEIVRLRAVLTGLAAKEQEAVDHSWPLAEEKQGTSGAAEMETKDRTSVRQGGTNTTSPLASRVFDGAVAPLRESLFARRHALIVELERRDPDRTGSMTVFELHAALGAAGLPCDKQRLIRCMAKGGAEVGTREVRHTTFMKVIDYCWEEQWL